MNQTLVEWVEEKRSHPDDAETVLVYSTTADEPVWLGFYDSEDEVWREVSGATLEGVTHWTRLPEPPSSKAIL